MLDSCECKHPPLVKDVIQVIWLLFQQHQNWHTFFYAQGPDFHKLGLCYYLKIMYL